MQEKVKLARHRNTSYFVKYDADGSSRQYTWAGSRNGKIDVKEVPKEVVDWLQMNSVCFDKGELVIVGEDDKTSEIKDGIIEKGTYENNTHSKEEIESLLKGNFNKMKSELKKITVDAEKNFVIEVATELKSGLPSGKLDFISDWMGIDSNVLFD
ncbi:hypothetical protein V1503_18890 [Bacillus sp. SCS-151]|uniref:hypothetical protein n=1 Tax=Nanhaiella sioensis TaxID=3115293 RepID=UPI0039795BA8